MSLLNILYLVDKKTYQTKMSRVRFHGIEEIAKKSNLIWSGLNWDNYDPLKTVQANIENIESKNRFKFDLVIGYKPLDLKEFCNVQRLTCIRYNEMYNFQWTTKEIEESKSDIVICHHENDMKTYIAYYSNYHGQQWFPKAFYHVPHCAKATVFRKYEGIERDVDFLLCGMMGNRNSLKDYHYPLRDRMWSTIFPKLRKLGYRCEKYNHPGYSHLDSFTDRPLIEFSKGIQRGKICITCSGLPKSRFGKYVEIPMSNSVIAGDIPDQDQDEFRKFVIEINMEMSDDEIIDKLLKYIGDNERLDKLREIGSKWASNWGQDTYATIFLNSINSYLGRDFVEEVKELDNNTKIYVVGADEDWVIDYLGKEWCDYNRANIVSEPEEATIIWLMADYKYRKIRYSILNEKKVITTIHHIDQDKLDTELINRYKKVAKFTNIFHVITDESGEVLKKILGEDCPEIRVAPFFVNENVWRPIDNTNELRTELQLPVNKFLVGSFQRDTEGSSVKKKNYVPKLSKGPDRFIKVVKMLHDKCPHVEVVLSGWRRHWVIQELNKLGIKYYYFEKAGFEIMNQLYSCLDLYVVGSRVEGGPRAIVECAAARVPIISTNVGIAGRILADMSLYDGEDIEGTLDECIPNMEVAYNNVEPLFLKNGYMKKFNRIFL
jgi:glycosyltransferase involved in cell wall biosynthesis